MILKLNWYRSWKNSLMFKSVRYSFRGPGFNFQHPHGAHNSFPGDRTLFLSTSNAHGAHTGNTHAQKIRIDLRGKHPLLLPVFGIIQVSG